MGAINLAKETPIPFKEILRHRLLRSAARDGERLDFSTIYRWHLRGLRGVKLEGVRVGGTLCTTEAAIIRFIERMSEPTATPAQIRREAANA